MIVNRGDIFIADIDKLCGHEQAGVRPVLIIQNNTGNDYSPTVIVAMITSTVKKKPLPTHIRLDTSVSNLNQNSTVLCEQIRTIDKSRLHNKVSHLNMKQMEEIDNALRISIDL